MSKYTSTIIVGLVVAAICALAIYLLTVRHKKEKQKWEQIAADNYIRGKDEASDLFRETCDKIEADKEKISQLSDREIFVEAMLALGSYGRRLDRIEAKLQCITNYKIYIDDMNELTQKLAQRFVVLDESISDSTATIVALKQVIQETSSGIEKLISDLSDLSNLHDVLGNHVANLSQLELDVKVLQERVAHVVDEMNAVMATNDQAPMKKLKLIETEITAIKDDLSKMSESTNSIKEKIDDSLDEYNNDGLLYKVNEIEQKTKDIDHKVDGVGSKIDNIAHRADDIYYEVDGAGSKLCDLARFGRLADDVESIKDKVECALDKWGYDSLYNKINELKS